MSLTRKTLLIIIMTMSLLTVLAELCLVSVLDEQFLRLETADAFTNVSRARRALFDEVNQLSTKGQDWSRWDDSYRFMEDHGKEFIASNITKDASENLAIVDIAFFSIDGKLDTDLQRDVVRESRIGEDFAVAVAPHRAIELALGGAVQSGIMPVGRDLVLFTAQPILTSQGEGPARGTLVFLKLLNSRLRAKLAVQTELALTMIPWSEISQADPQLRRELSESVLPLLRRSDESSLSAFTLIRDPWGTPFLVMRIDLPRTIYLQGIDTRSLLLFLLGVGGAVITGVMIALLHWQVIRRLQGLSREVDLVSTTRNTAHRMTVQGRDEIAAVGKGLNEMLNTLNEYEHELRRAKDSAEAASVARAQFVANVSHEVRTPMNGILGMTEVLLRMENGQEQTQYIRMVQGCAQALLGIINDILDFSKIDAGKLELELVPFELESIIGEALQTVTFRAQEKGLELLCDYDPSVPYRVIGDPLRLRQVLVNLLGNAVKFTSEGAVRLSVSALSSSESQTTLRFAVIDTGVGISPERQPMVFDAFTQEDGSTSRKFGGTGLGLTISRDIVRAFGSDIELSSEVGSGSTFSFELTLPIDGTSEPRVAEAPDAVVALISAPGPFRDWLHRTLEGMVRSVSECEDLGSLDRPYVIVDADTRWEDSLIVCESAKLSAVRKIVCLAISHGDRAASFRDAVNTVVLLKPVLPGAFRAALSERQMPETFSRIVLGAGGDGKAHPLRGRAARVLVVDDVEVNRDVVRLLLQPLGHTVSCARNGREAVEMLRAAGHFRPVDRKQPFDIVFMDEQMPELDGVEATRLIRAEERSVGVNPGIPIIGCSAHAGTGDWARLLEAGMSDSLPKPLSGEAITETLRRWCGADAAVSSSPGPTDFGAREACLDVRELFVRYGGDNEAIREILELSRDDLGEYLQRIERAMEAGELSAVARAAHALKGIFQNIAANRAADVAKSLEQLAMKNNGGEDEIDPLLRSAVGRLFKATRDLEERVVKVLAELSMQPPSSSSSAES